MELTVDLKENFQTVLKSGTDTGGPKVNTFNKYK